MGPGTGKTGGALRESGDAAGVVGLRHPAGDGDGIGAGRALAGPARCGSVKAAIGQFRVAQNRAVATRLVAGHDRSQGAIRQPVVGETPINWAEVATARKYGYHIERDEAEAVNGQA